MALKKLFRVSIEKNSSSGIILKIINIRAKKMGIVKPFLLHHKHAKIEGK
jgi:hypothetical protein